MDKPFEIKIIKNNSLKECNNGKPFELFINGEKIENVRRFSIDLDRDKLVERKLDRHGREATYINDWIYIIEYFLTGYDDLVDDTY